MAYAVQALTHYQTYPERPPGADLHPKKVNNLVPMAPRHRHEGLRGEHERSEEGAVHGSLGVFYVGCTCGGQKK